MRFFQRLVFLLTLSLASAAFAEESEPIVRVRVIYTLPELTLTPLDEYAMKVGGKNEAIPLDADAPLTIKAVGSNVEVRKGDVIVDSKPEIELNPATVDSRVKIKDVPFGIGWWWAGKEDREYEGRIVFRVSPDNKLEGVVTLPIERYLRGVVPSEIGGDSPTEALRSQAIAARSDTWNALKNHGYAGKNYDICADVECQVFSGNTKQTAAATKAIDDTRGLVLLADGKPMSAYYASNCGGCSDLASNAWPTREAAAPYSEARFDADAPLPFDLTKEEDLRKWVTTEPDVYCNPKMRKDIPNWTTKNFRWKVETTAEDLTKLVAKQKDIGRVIAIKAVERGPSGRLKKARFIGENGELEVGPELAIRNIWNPPLRGSGFVVDAEGGTPEKPEKFVLTGSGWGHGVGMCQTGAVIRATNGQDFRTILGHYYKGAEITPVYK
ncbi:SpoIID/LytB domain-containing protein [Candidatus Sumerlaeota bacterium]|nr:SpoIID/LytB domain-containing protein [Candidatus Sumerlaeota bacterium]